MHIAKTSGALSTSQSVRVGQGLITHLQSGDQQSVWYDSTSATGTILAILPALDHMDFSSPLQFQTGLFCSVATTTSGDGAVAHLI